MGIICNLCVVFMFILDTFAQNDNNKQFIYNGFKGSNLHVDGLADIRPNGLLQMTNTSKQQSGHVFYPKPIKFQPFSSFSTCFVFAMNPDVPNHGGHGIAFVIAPSINNFAGAVPAEYLGLFNLSNNGLTTNHVFAVELDTVQNAIFGDIDGNHLGIDVNGLTSISSASASYYSDSERRNESLDLTSMKPMQVWVDYDGNETMVNVTIAPIRHPKPSTSLLSARVNLSLVFGRLMFVGFSSSTGLTANEHYLLGWSWNQTGLAQGLDPSKLPPLPKFGRNKAKVKLVPTILLVLLLVLVVVVVGVVFFVRKRMYEEYQEEWELEFTSHRFSYKDLHMATKGFKESELLGSGGFGKVYKGVLPKLETRVAVKKISHDSKQGMQQFVSEIASLRRLRHRNLLQLLGYCRRKGELLLVYDYMPNGSLDKFLFKNTPSLLSWSYRISIIKGVASALLYLHEEWEQVVLHRDVKASNVLLDSEMNPRLGDFGLARLYDRGSNPRSTRVVGTVGYLAPELSITGKPTTSTDVYAFGIFVLEVCCGRRPFSPLDAEDFILVDWVFECWKSGDILGTSDPKLEGNYVAKEMELVLKLGLLCTHCKSESRPSMRHVVRFLRGDVRMPDIPQDYDHQRSDLYSKSWGTSSSFPSTFEVSKGNFFSQNSVVHHGR